MSAAWWHARPPDAVGVLVEQVLAVLPNASAHHLVEMVHEQLGGSRDSVALQIGDVLGELRLERVRDETPERYLLSGDARLQFWREAYLTALRARLDQMPPTVAYDRAQLIVVSDAASTLADLAVTAHLVRCQPRALDDIVAALHLLLPAKP